MTAGLTGLLLAAVSLAALALHQQSPQQPPTFRSSTELVLIETHVVARDGTPMTGLKPEQFEVFIDGRRRPVTAAEFIRANDTAPAAGSPSGAGGGEAADRSGRTIVIAVDQSSFPVSSRAAAREAATRVLNRVAPEDHLGMIAFPGPVAVAPTRDRAAVREAIDRISGQRVNLQSSKFNISASEATALKSRESVTTREIINRECPDMRNPTCPAEVVQDGGMIADTLEQQAVQTISGLHGVIDAIGPLPGRKTLMLISAGLPMRPGGRPDLDSATTAIAKRAAAANVNLYVFYMNVHFLQAFSAAQGKPNYSIYNDITMFGYGLEKFSDSSGGSFFQVEVNSDPFVDRALRETSAAYVLAVQVRPEDRDGKDHFIRVSVKQKGATVRYRRVVTIPRLASKFTAEGAEHAEAESFCSARSADSAVSLGQRNRRHQSHLNARSGSTRVARRAGRYVATAPATARISATPT